MDKERTSLYFWKMPTALFPRVRINSAGLSRCAPDWSWDSSLIPWFDDDLWYIAGGEGRLETPEGEFSLTRGDCFVLKGGHRYRGSHDPEKPLTVYFIHFSGTAALPDLHHRVSDPGFFEGLLGRTLEQWNQGEAEKAQQWLEAALSELGASVGVSVPRRAEVRGAAVSDDLRSRLLSLCGEVHHHPERVHRVQLWASSLGLSRQHFCRVFASVVGRTPRAFLVQARIENAKMLLRYSDHPLKRVAFLCGFRDEFYFSRSFSRHVGVSPGTYKRRET